MILLSIMASIMKVNEVFYSTQGEGINIGKPTIFLRLAECNLFCKFCDSKYSWTESKDYTIFQLLKEIRKFPCTNICITGGEPLLQQKELKKLVEQLPEYYIEIETNGTVIPDTFLFTRVNQWNVSIKLASSGADEDIRIFSFAINQFRLLKFVSWKFVMTGEEDIEEFEQLVEKFSIPLQNIILMPEGVSVKSMQEKLWLVDYCKENNIRYSPRLHIILYGNKRAV